MKTAPEWENLTESLARGLITMNFLTTKVGRVEFRFSVEGQNLFWAVGNKLNMMSVSKRRAQNLVKKHALAISKMKTIAEVNELFHGPMGADAHHT